MKNIHVLSITVLAMLLAALQMNCDQQRPAPGGGTPTIPPFNSSGPLPNTPIRPGGLCVPGAVDLVRQTNAMTLAITLDAGGIFDRVGLTATGGTYVFSIQTLLPNCTASPLAPLGPITVTYGLNYIGDFSRGQSICINASRADFTSFSISGIGVLDGIVEMAVKDNIHRRIDFEVANRMNSLLNGSPLPNTAAVRCGNWIELPPPGQ